MPVDVTAVTVQVPTGVTSRGVPEARSIQAWVAHFATCPNAGTHRRS